MLTTGVFLGVVALFALGGFKKGLLGSFLDLMAVAVTYLALLFLYRPAAAALQATGKLPGMSAWVVAPLALVLGVAIVFQLVGVLLGRRRRDDEVPRFRLAGAAVNAVTGLFYASLAVWGVMLYRGVAHGGDGDLVRPPFVERFAGALVGSLGSAAVRITLTDERLAVPAASRVLTDPAAGMRSVQAIAQSPRFTELLADPEFQEALDTAPATEVAGHPALEEALADPTLEAAFRDLGLMETPEQERELRIKLATAMGLVHRRLQELQGDPEFLAILNEPGFKAAVESRDVVKLLRHRDTARFLELIMQGSSGPPPAPAAPQGR